MPASRVQWKANTAQNDPASAVLDAAPAVGNLLVVVASERSGNSHTLFTITGTGWTKAFGVDAALADTTYRRSIAVWWKLAAASEPTGVTVDNGTTSTKRILIQEFTTGDTRTFGSVISANNNNGATGSATSLSTGTTASTSGDQLLVGVLNVKRGAVTTTYTSSWTNGLGNAVDAVVATNSSQDWCSAFAETSASGTNESTATISASASNVGLTGGILAVALGGAGATLPRRAPVVRSQAVNRAASF